MNRKKIIAIIVLILTIFVLGLIAYLFAGNKTDDPSGEDSTRGFFPFGRFEEDERTGFGTTTDDREANRVPVDGPIGENGLPSYRKLSIEPTSGAIFVISKGEEAVRHISRETGHIFDSHSTSSEIKRISNTTIPGIQKTVWRNGESVILQYLRDGSIESFYARIVPPESGAGTSTATTSESLSPEEEDQRIEVVGTFLQSNISQIAVSPNNSGFVTFTNKENGSLLTLLSNEGGTLLDLFSSPMSDFLINWPTPKTISLQTKSSHGLSGQLFLLDTDSLNLDHPLINVLGLSAVVSPDGNRVIYSSSSEGNTDLFMRDFVTGQFQRLVTPTISEKCTWSKSDIYTVYCAVPTETLSGNLPDSWYKGITSFTDELWKINVETGGAQILFSGLQDGVDIDAIELKLNPEETRLILINKKDLSLWMFELPQEDLVEEEGSEDTDEDLLI